LVLNLAAKRAPLMALALVALFAGVWGGLVRIGPVSTTAVASASEAHGPLMALGFLGTLISLERAVALGRWWSYTAPVATGLGAIATLASAPGDLGPALMTVGGFVLLAGPRHGRRALRRQALGCRYAQGRDRRERPHGFPRIGPRRELKAALEGYWAGERTAADLRSTSTSTSSWRADSSASPWAPSRWTARSSTASASSRRTRRS
jgi:hypothetical protein